ncbi:MAG: hypothetical protein GU347_01895 [Desulfurococcales archaeon]|jgi:hypothetical protein|nr:hypothetical protein [Desulfurococcales archaeon]
MKPIENEETHKEHRTLVITENLALHGEDNEEGEKVFFASAWLEILEDVPLLRRKFKHKHSPCLNERYGMEER